MKNHKPPPKGSSQKPPTPSGATPSSSSQRKSRWESEKPSPNDRSKPSKAPKPSPKHDPSAATPGRGSDGPPRDQIPPPHPPLPAGAGAAMPSPPPAYGFHMLERRTIVLADGSVRSYFALPPDEFPQAPSMPGGLRPPIDHFGGPPPPIPPHRGPGMGFDNHFPPRGGLLSPDDFRRDRDDPFARGGPYDPRGPPPVDGPSLKRKYGEEDRRDDFMRHQLYQHGNPNPNGYRGDFLVGPSSPPRRDRPMDDSHQVKHARVGSDGYGDMPRRGRGEENLLMDVDPQALKRAFLRFSKTINEVPSERKNYLENGKYGPLQCGVCGRSSKDFKDVHELVMHAYNSQHAELRVDHLGLHKALCVLMGWNYAKPPDHNKAYQSLPAVDVAMNREDLIMWPPTVIIHNTISGKRKDGRMEGMGNKDMDNKLKELGFGGGKSRSIYGKEGHLGVTVVKFANTHTGLKEAEHLSEYFEKENHARKGWARAEASKSGGGDDNNNPLLVKIDDKSREKKRTFYGYLATASDLEKVDSDTRKKAVIKSRRALELLD
ncbi:hypothetical protein QJS04_geneDACA013039 [Acorus gramineus]|uniref:XS domain-containing protein n=1 Tax=Acorus gramineus TaxID=55184 RepID=A0AAV9B751_ACOGR|nr:hypothetical protein QJS04_geneDACA013039 [Acorus gramineus]